MVLLSLQSLRTSENGLRFFPYSGHLGLTPVVVEGVVLTKKDEEEDAYFVGKERFPAFVVIEIVGS